MSNAQLPISNLIDEIVSDENIRGGYDYVVSHLENRYQREKYMVNAVPKGRQEFDSDGDYELYLERQERVAELRERIIARLKDEIGSGTFRITAEDVDTIEVTDGPKRRICQAPRVVKRIGCHCIMVVFERHTFVDLIRNTAASVKGRGTHWLHHIIEDDIRFAPDLFRFFYKNDIKDYYGSIPQDGMKAVVRRYVADEVLLPMLDNFIELLPKGLSKGLRSSQAFGNLYLTEVHKRMLEMCARYFLCHPDGVAEVRYLYYNYCDDTAFAAPDKKTLWRMRDVYVREIGRLGLRVKPDEAVRPIGVGLDMVGYVHYPTHSLLRKRIKQNAARKLKRIRSWRRRREVAGSFKGMAFHGDCKHIYYTLTHHRMKKFSEIGVVYQPADGKKRFPGRVTKLSAIQNMNLEIHDYETEINTSQGEGRYLVSVRICHNGEWAKFFTASEEMKNILDQISDIEDGFPFKCTIRSEIFDGNKVKYVFSDEFPE